MLYRSLFPRDVFAELDRLQRDLRSVLDPSPGIRGIGRSGFPALNVATTPESVELYAFAPGLDPNALELTLDRGVLTLSGERAPVAVTPPEGQDRATTTHQQERFSGRFRRVVSLPDDIDPDGVHADYRDGVLRVSVRRRAAARPRRIEVQ